MSLVHLPRRDPNPTPPPGARIHRDKLKNVATVDESSELARRLELAFDLYEAGEEIMRRNLERRHPEADSEEIERRLLDWLHTRPGAELGDAVGKPVEWPRKAG